MPSRPPPAWSRKLCSGMPRSRLTRPAGSSCILERTISLTHTVASRYVQSICAFRSWLFMCRTWGAGSLLYGGWFMVLESAVVACNRFPHLAPYPGVVFWGVLQHTLMTNTPLNSSRMPMLLNVACSLCLLWWGPLLKPAKSFNPIYLQQALPRHLGPYRWRLHLRICAVSIRCGL